MYCFYSLFNKYYECPVCFNIKKIKYLVLFKCGHSLCYNCSKHIKKCPICRAKVGHRYNIRTILSVNSLSNQIDYFYCSNCRCIFNIPGINKSCNNCSSNSDIFKVYFN